jgi:uncharacterized protein
MKPSRYNHTFTVEGSDVVLAYNGYTGALAEIEAVNHPRVQQLLEDSDRAETAQDHEFVRCLRQGGFLIADAVDEIAVLKSKARRLRLEGTILTLTIAPTLACNFDCDYCYESQSGIRMSREAEDALLRYSNRYLNRADRLRVCWFGGEPTLCIPIIDRLQSQLLELADKRRIGIIPGTIITNGYLLDAKMAEHLKDLNITQAQITIDGPEAVHDGRRKLRNGKGTFKRIIDNLCDTAGILNISVRINVDRGNVDHVYEAIEILQHRDILPKVRVYFAQVRSSGSACADIRDRCYGDEEFSRTLAEIYGKLVEMGIQQIDFPRVFVGAAFCGALSEGYFVVSPTGHLFKCWEELSLDSRNSVGDVFSTSPSDQQMERSQAYAAWDPLSMAECRGCDILPICMGGCPVLGMRDPSASKGVCLPWKYNLRRMVELKYLCETREPAYR